MTALLDTNILIKMLSDDEPMHDWCVETVEARRSEGPALIPDIVFCEFSIGMASLNEVSEAIAQLGIERLTTDDEMLFRAGVAYRAYRQTDGVKTNVLSDFLIGAAASVHGLPLITTNRKDFVGYFPEVEVVSPEAAE